MHKSHRPDKIIFFDGICILCNRSVDFILKRDHKRRFKFASLQSDFSVNFFKQLRVDQSGINSIVFYDEGKVFTKSAAVLKIAGHLGFPFAFAFILFLVPGPLRDWVYDYIARNRYKWFGKRSNCRLPDEETQGQIIA